MINVKIKVLLVDDEPDAIEVMTTLLNRLFPDRLEITGTAFSVAEAVKKVEELQPQLVFLDIQMPDGTGLGFLKMFETLPFEVIFVTGFDQYAINAIRLSALDYLLKPVEIDDLVNAVQRAEKIIAGKKLREGQMQNLLGNLGEQFSERKLAVHKGDMVHYIPLKSIVSLEALGNYTSIETTEGEQYITSHSLKVLEEMFADTSTFIRVSRSFTLNAAYIQSYSKNEPYYVYFGNGRSTEISRRKRQAVIEWLRGKL